MASSNNALWIGAIVIVAALTAVELMSNRDDADATAESIDSNTITGSVAPVSPQFDTGEIAVNTAKTPPDGHESVQVEPIESDFQFDTESEFASDLIVDLDNPQAHVTAITESEQSEPEMDAANNTEDMLTDTGLSTDETDATQTLKAESIAITPLETVVQSVEEEITNEQTQTGPANDSSLMQPAEQLTIEEAPVHFDISQHLAAAEEAVKALRMTTPAGDNAYEHYQAVLAIDPDNAAAHAGIEKMVDMYIHFAEKEIAKDHLNTARVYLQRAEYLRPGSPKLKNLHAELD